MQSFSDGNKLYLYQLLSGALGTQRQTLIAQAEEAITADGIDTQALGYNGPRAILEALPDFVEVITFRKGNTYVIVHPVEAWDEQLQKSAQEPEKQKQTPARGAKQYRRRAKELKAEKPVPRVVRKRKPAAAAGGAGTEAAGPASATPASVATSTGTAPEDVTAAELSPAAEVPELDNPAPAEAPALDKTAVEEPTLDATPVEAPIADATPAGARAAEEAPEAAQETAAVHDAPETVGPQSEVQPEPASPEDSATTPAAHKKQVESQQQHKEAEGHHQQKQLEGHHQHEQPEEHRQHKQHEQRSQHAQRPAQAEPAPKGNGLVQPLQWDLPMRFEEDVVITSAALMELSAALPLSVPATRILSEDWYCARGAGLLGGTHNHITYPLRYLKFSGTEPAIATLQRTRTESGHTRWHLTEVDCGKPEDSPGFDLGLWDPYDGLALDNQGPIAALCARTTGGAQPFTAATYALAHDTVLGSWDLVATQLNETLRAAGQNGSNGTHTSASTPAPEWTARSLRAYLSAVYAQAKADDLLVRTDSGHLLFNTGLTSQGKEVFCIFVEHQRTNQALNFGPDVPSRSIASQPPAPCTYWTFDGFAAGVPGALSQDGVQPPSAPSFDVADAAFSPDASVSCDAQELLASQAGHLPADLLDKTAASLPLAQALLEETKSKKLRGCAWARTYRKLMELLLADGSEETCGALEQLRMHIQRVVASAVQSAKNNTDLVSYGYDLVGQHPVAFIPLSFAGDAGGPDAGDTSSPADVCAAGNARPGDLTLVLVPEDGVPVQDAGKKDPDAGAASAQTWHAAAFIGRSAAEICSKLPRK